MTCFPSYFTFGEIDPKTLPTLPDGWSYKFHLEDFGFLIGPDGEHYYLQLEGKTVWGLRCKIAGLWDFIRTHGRLAYGKAYCDDRKKVSPWLEVASRDVEYFTRKELMDQMKRGKS